MLRNYIELPRAVHILCLGTFINRAGTLVVPFMTIYLQEERHLGTQFATLGMGAYGLGACCATLIGGHLADHIGRRVVMIVGLLGGAGLLLTFSMLTAPWAMIAVLVAFALVAEMYRPATSAMIGDLVEPERRPHAYGLMYMSVNLGFAIGPLVAGLLARRSFKLLFWGDALTSAIYAGIILLMIRETLPRARGAARGGQDEIPKEHGGAVAADAPISAGFGQVLRDGVFLTFCLGAAFMGVVIMQSMSTFPLYMEHIGFGPEVYGRTIALNGIMIVCLQVPMTAIMSRFNRANVIAAASVIAAVGFGATAWASTPLQLAATVAIWTIGEIMQAPLMPSIVNDLAPAALRARYFGVLGLTFSSANMLGAPLGGVVLAHWGGRVLWVGCLVAATISALLFATLHARIGRRHGA